jgi:hypothetical protein
MNLKWGVSSRKSAKALRSAQEVTMRKLLVIMSTVVLAIVGSTAVVTAQQSDNCLSLGNGQQLCFEGGQFVVMNDGMLGQAQPDQLGFEQQFSDPYQGEQFGDQLGFEQQFVNPDYGLDPQPQIGHPSFYRETGMGKTRDWSVQLEPGTVAIIGGVAVDGKSGGVYKAVQGPGKVSARVTDGFMLVIKDEWAQNEFCFRVGQAYQYDWARRHIEPLPGWSC